MKKIFFLLIEHFLILLSVFTAVVIRFHGDLSQLYAFEYLIAKVALITVTCQLCLYFNDFYDFKITINPGETLGRLIQSLGASAIILAAIYYIFPLSLIGRGIFVITIIIIVFLICLWRLFYWRILKFKTLKENILILGSGKMAKTVVTEVLSHAYSNINIVGFVDNNKKMKGKSIVNPKVLGTYDELLTIIREKNVGKIVIAVDDRRGGGGLPINALMDCRFKGIIIEEATTFYEKITGKIMVENLKPSWLIFSEGFKKLMFSKKLKRIMGITFSFFGIIFLSPVIAVTVIAIKLTSSGPVFYKQERVGENGKNFTLLKFRSMKADAESASGPVWASDNDARITKIGRFLRKSRIDEIPQLFNLFKGDMDFVGPRPERPFFVEQLKKQIPYYSQRLSVKPGITGWAQIKYQYGSSVEDALEKLQYDLYYIKNGSLLLDVFIIFETVKVVLLGKGT